MTAAIGRPYTPRRVYLMVLVVMDRARCQYVSLDIEEGTLEDALDHLYASETRAQQSVDVHIVETAGGD